MLDSLPLVREPAVRAGWRLTLCPDAGEAGGCFVPRRRPAARGAGGVPNPERSRHEAARRARAQLRRYCAANGLNRLGTLTYAPPFCTDAGQVRQDVGIFFRALRDQLGGAPFPYAWVPEFHADGSRYHVHFAVGRYVRQRLIQSTWGHGYVHIKLLSDLPVGSGRLQESRAAAGYLSKYVSKAFADAAIPGRHRYDVAQGFQPQRVQIWGRSADEVVGIASQSFGGLEPIRYWRSDDQDGWAWSAGGVGAMGRLSDDEVRAWLAASCTAQGVPLLVTDDVAVNDVCALLGARTGGPARRGSAEEPPAA